MSATEWYADPADVRNELEREGHPTEEIDATQLESFLDKAHMLTAEELSEVGHSEKRLKHIEACLAGHYILDSGIDSLRQATRMQEHDGTLRWFGDIQEWGLRGTSLGQQALELDTSGTLADIADQNGLPDDKDHHFELV